MYLNAFFVAVAPEKREISSHNTVTEQGIVNILAGAAYIDREDEYLMHASYLFHQKSGYTEVAHMKGIGKKFDRWYDLLWMQKKI